MTSPPGGLHNALFIVYRRTLQHWTGPEKHSTHVTFEPGDEFVNGSLRNSCYLQTHRLWGHVTDTTAFLSRNNNMLMSKPTTLHTGLQSCRHRLRTSLYETNKSKTSQLYNLMLFVGLYQSEQGQINFILNRTCCIRTIYRFTVRFKFKIVLFKFELILMSLLLLSKPLCIVEFT